MALQLGTFNYSVNSSLIVNSTPIIREVCTWTISDPDGGEVDGTYMVIFIILGVFSVIGTVGNGLVIYVYTHKKDKLTSSVFILALAGTDIITCTIVIPYTIVAIYENYNLMYDAACKLYFFLITSNVPLSAFIMVAIAVDRYICICHPFVHIMTVPRAKAIVSLLGAFACVLGLMTALSYDVYQFPRDLQDVLQINVTLERIDNCQIVYTGGCHQSSKILSLAFSEVYQKIYSSFYLVSILLVMILYALIYRSVLLQRAKRQKQKKRNKPNIAIKSTPATTFSTTMVQTEVTSATILCSTAINVKVDANENGKTEIHKLNNGETVPLKSPKPTSQKEKKDHTHLANIKTAIMLGVVTIVFTVAFLPAWLMALGWVNFHPFVFYLYFVYNVANPVIYAFMNPMFRQDLIALYSSCVRR